ncbi:MAG: hypothetical protein ABI556_03355 [Gemmatimonadales bacterium]
MKNPPPTIWAVNDGEKIGRDQLGHALSRCNSVWDGRGIRLFGARNEVIAFQLIVEAETGPIDELTASLSELTHESGATIAYTPPSTDPTDYVDRPIQFFPVRYMNVIEPTTARWIYRDGANDVPDHRVGWKPVQLVPENALQDGFPLTVLSGHLQPIWIEIYLGRDLPAGIYHGQVKVLVDGVTSHVPVELEVFDFSLPDVNSLPTMVYYDREQPERYHGRNIDAMYHRFAHRHRIELVQEYGCDGALAAMGRLRGDDFTRGRGYEGPGEGAGNTIVPFSFYAPGTSFDERDSAWRTSDEWLRFIAEWLPDAVTFLYLFDEPGPAQFPMIRQISANIKSNPGPGSQLPLLVTRHYTPELDGVVDIWDCPATHYNIQDAEAERTRGRDHWACNGGRPACGAIVIDAPATDARMMPWACFKHGIKVYFYWHSVHWMHNAQKPEDRVQNVWENTITFDNRGELDKPPGSQGFGNGDGVLIYPGEDTLHPDEDRGIAGPISTVQLANLRRGLQDHLYLTLARERGLDAEVTDALQAVVPRVFSDSDGTIGFAEGGDTYEAARHKLAVGIASTRT